MRKIVGSGSCVEETFLTAYDVKEKAVVTPENWIEWVV